MTRKKLTEENKEFIRKNRLKWPARILGEKIGLGKGIVQRFLQKEGLTPPREVSLEFKRKALTGRTVLTPEQDEFIKKNYLQIPVKTMARKMGAGETAVINRLRQLGLKIPREIIEKRKMDSRLKPGNIPPNKGKKQEEYMSPESIEKTKKTRFKKGNKPPNTYDKNGVITIRKDSNGNKYKWIKISDGEWIPLHIHIWMKENGPVPEDKMVVFKDGNQMNCEVSNLELITMADNMKRNTIHRYPPVLKKTLRLLGRLNKKLERNEQQ